jgi:hypothetical protein
MFRFLLTAAASLLSMAAFADVREGRETNAVRCPRFSRPKRPHCNVSPLWHRVVPVASKFEECESWLLKETGRR